MSISFYKEFVEAIATIYKRYCPGPVRQITPSISTEFHWLSITFGIVHFRGIDDLFIRYDSELNVDISAGCGSSLVCLRDEKGLHWLPLAELGRSNLSENDKRDIESILNEVYALCLEKQEMLAVLLRGVEVANWEPLEVDSCNEWG